MPSSALEEEALLTRRTFALAPAAWLTAGAGLGIFTPAAVGAATRSPAFPAQDPARVRDAVVAAHGNVAALRALVGRQPALAKAAYDWGFGDWETALGGAAHIGHREIAVYLIANGAQPTIFSAAMLGQLDVVKAFVAAAPGVHRIAGPHGIPLLRHALAGGAAARPVVDYLTALGDADAAATALLTAAEVAMLAGAYVPDDGGPEPVTVAAANGQLTFALAGRSRGLRHLGSLAFHPAGAEHVRVVFAPGTDGVRLTVHDPDVVLRARKAVEE
jgi:hypothetical protein